jgi:hypothetical protein
MLKRSVARSDRGARRGTFGWIFSRSFVALAFIYVAFSLWVMASHLPVGTIERGPELLLIVPAFMAFMAGLTALILTAVWWLCWGWWHPVARPATPPRPSRASGRSPGHG